MTETAIKSVKFDPGFAQHTTILSINLEYIYAKINSYKNLGQRKRCFKFNYKQIQRMTDNNIGFCLGSILWAVYIKSLGNLPIEGSPCYGDTFDKDETCGEIDFSIEYYEQLKKDAKYYIAQNYEINPYAMTILNLYKEFLLENKNFTSTKTTDDIVLPKDLKTPTKEDLAIIYEKIEEVIKSGNLLDLTSVFGLVYEK
ncbi:hypothetical protein J6I39_03285 [bacterium]|nr:hypothetical protein [bacterium]